MSTDCTDDRKVLGMNSRLFVISGSTEKLQHFMGHPDKKVPLDTKKSMEEADKQFREVARREAKREAKKAIANQPGRSAAVAKVAKEQREFSKSVRSLAVSNALESSNHKDHQKHLLKAAEAFSRKFMKQGGGDLPSLLEWLQSAAGPLGMPAVRCPVQKNTIESNRTTVARMSYTGRVQVTSLGRCDLVLFPGHGLMPQRTETGSSVYNMDPTSFHGLLQTIKNNGVDIAYVLGPVGDGTRSPAIGFVRTAAINEYFTTTSNETGTSPILSNTPLPYSASAGDGSHTRWRLTALGIKVMIDDWDGSLLIKSATPLGRVPQLQGSVGFDNIFAKDPSYKRDVVSAVAGKVSKTFVIPWQPDQLAFWHSIDPAAANGGAINSIIGGSFFMQMDNMTSTAFYFDYEVVAHWELAGNNLLAVSRPTAQSTDAANLADQTTAKLNRLGDARDAVGAAQHVATQTHGLLSDLAEGAKTVAEVGHKVVKIFGGH